MKISYSFYSLKNLSDLSYGERLIEILISHGLTVEKADVKEPIRKEFVIGNLHEVWKGVGLVGECSSCHFLFKGINEIKFMGMVTWHVNLHPNGKEFNTIHLWLNIPNKYDFNKLVQLGNDIFTWSEGVYGYITEESSDPSNELTGNIYDGIPGLMWANYFGIPYTKEINFHLLDGNVPVSHGVRLMLSEKPNDERLNDVNFIESITNEIGVEWFWSKPRKYNKKIPHFDRRAITRR